MKTAMMVCLIFFISNTFAYDALDRYSLLEDKFKTEEMLRPLGHDFLVDFAVRANKNLKNFVDDIGDVGDAGGTTANKINEAGSILMKHDRTEQTIHSKINIGIPIFGMKFGNISFDPNIRIGVEFGSNMGIRSEALTNETVLQLVGNQIPMAFRSAIASTNFNRGEDIMERVCNDRHIPLNACPYRGQYYYPEHDFPLVAVYTKFDTKAGLYVPYKGRYWFGDINLYGMFRSDFNLLMTADQIARGQGPLEGAKDLKKQVFLMADYKLGYRRSNYHFFFSIEELKVARLSENIKEAGELHYETPPLFRFHMAATYRPGIFLFRPFLGVHKREGYDYEDGAYLGLDVGTYVLNDHLGLLFRLMGDQEHLSFSSKFKFTLFHLEYFLRTPLKDEIEDLKISTIHSINLRFSI